MPSEDSKPVKKEDINKKPTKPSLSSKVPKVKKEEPEPDSPTPVRASTSASRSKQPTKVKKEDNDIDDDDNKPLAKRASNVSKTKEVKKKKVYDLPGQKRDPPEEKDPLRIFYETLYKQIPTSEMSQIWLMESGLLPKEIAMKVYQKKQNRGPQQKLTSPVKAVAAAKSSTKSVTVKKKSITKSVTVKKKHPTSPVPSVEKKTTDSMLKHKWKSEDSSDDDFVLPAAKRRKAAQL